MNTAVTHLLNASLSQSSICSYKNSINRYCQFHNIYYAHTPLLPVSTAQLAQFIALCHAQDYRPATITSYVSAIGYIHKIQGLPNPADSFLIKKLLHGTRRSSCADKRHPFTLTQLQTLINTLPQVAESEYACILFKAMILTAFFALLRVGEFCLSRTGRANLLTWDQVTFHRNNNKVTSALITMYHYKHSTGRPALIPLARQCPRHLCPIRALLRYRKKSPLQSGPLFHDQRGLPIPASQFRTVLKDCVIRSHLDPALYTGHSLRIGGATLAHLHKMPPESIRLLGRWRSQAFQRYIRPPQLQIDQVSPSRTPS